MKKISVWAVVVTAAIMASCGGRTPKADLKNDLDSLSYAFGIAQTQGLKEYLTMRMGVDTTEEYMDDFIKGLNEGVNAGDDKAKTAYFAGLQIGQQISQQMVKGINMELFGEDSTQTISVKNLVAGFVAGTTGKGALMSMDAATMYTRDGMADIKARVAAKKFGDYKKKNEEFMKKIAKKDGVRQIDSTGVYYEVITEGDGAVPEDTSTVEVRYAGTLIDGTEFDSNMNADLPMKFQANQVIPGWREALTHMPAGSTWKVYIPADMAYGENQAGEKIKPFSTLVFTIQLIK
ncbi:MAG: FKBP-type peptidyl-prolyl cis-trans isomerase [Bacteroidaceae bacterium]|nr:FKBP-type peptidyl-prolyl cis-trans isomerase [Bacteroidaceae bacterium]